jgi:hypothetical protein
MSFANDVQRGRVCAALTAWIPGAPHWRPRPELSDVPRPTDHVFKVIDGEVPCAGSEREMMRIAVDMWNGNGGSSFATALHSFDRRNLAMVGSLLVAIAGETSADVERWLAQYEGR